MDRGKFHFIWETLATFYALLSLWPWMLGLRPRALWWINLLFALVLMLVVARRRIRRLHRMKDEQEEQGPPRAPFGPSPPNRPE